MCFDGNPYDRSSDINIHTHTRQPPPYFTKKGPLEMLPGLLDLLLY